MRFYRIHPPSTRICLRSQKQVHHHKARKVLELRNVISQNSYEGLLNYEYSIHSNEYNKVDIFSKFEQNLAGKIFVTH